MNFCEEERCRASATALVALAPPVHKFFSLWIFAIVDFRLFPFYTLDYHHYPLWIFAIVDWKHTFAIEIKSANAPEAKLSANTKKYLELRKDDNARNAVFYLGNVSMTINGTSYVAWKDWGDFL